MLRKLSCVDRFFVEGGLKDDEDTARSILIQLRFAAL